MKYIFNVSALLLIAATSPVLAKEKPIGHELYEKKDLAVADLPSSALATIMSYEPSFEVKEVQQETKHGKQYLDVEGITKSGAEIEFDMLLNEQKSWDIVEIQRDIEVNQMPIEVQKTLSTHLSDKSPQRIIESKQMTGEVVYEFYFVASGKTTKQEIKWLDGKAELLTEEWAH